MCVSISLSVCQSAFHPDFPFASQSFHTSFCLSISTITNPVCSFSLWPFLWPLLLVSHAAMNQDIASIQPMYWASIGAVLTHPVYRNFTKSSWFLSLWFVRQMVQEHFLVLCCCSFFRHTCFLGPWCELCCFVPQFWYEYPSENVVSVGVDNERLPIWCQYQSNAHFSSIKFHWKICERNSCKILLCSL